MSDPTYPLFPIFAFLGFVCALIPLPWHLEAWNSGTCYYMIWTALACLNQFVNSVVWHNNALNPAPIWCDISTRIMLGASVGIPAASLCINKRLYHIASIHAITVTRAEKKRAVLIDSLICVLFPIVYIVLQYVVQGHRFNIYEDIGCYPVIYNTLLAYFLGSIWPIILGLISAVYCVLSLRAFMSRRSQFSEFLSSNTSLSISRYFRLMALAMTDIIYTTPLAIFVIWLDATAQPIEPWRSWDDTHFDFSRVDQIPALIWRNNRLLLIAMELSRWVVPFCALVFFAFFGFADEARKHYASALAVVKKYLHLQRKPLSGSLSMPRRSEKPKSQQTGSLPVFIPFKKPLFLSSSANSTVTLGYAGATPIQLTPSTPSTFSHSPLQGDDRHDGGLNDRQS